MWIERVHKVSLVLITPRVMNDINALKNQQRDKHPGFDSYLECMTRGLFSGLATFAFGEHRRVHALSHSFTDHTLISGFSGFYFAQKLLSRRLPYNEKYFILISGVIGASAAYSVTKSKTYVCQKTWVDTEHPELSK